jgi:hypothetical protein
MLIAFMSTNFALHRIGTKRAGSIKNTIRKTEVLVAKKQR